MKKKILSAIVALCVGIFLCITTAFAANYWYSIQNNAGVQTVTMGRAVYLSVKNTEGSATGVYQGSRVQFNTVTVVAPKWSTPSANVTNPSMPTFDLKLNVTKDLLGTPVNPVPSMTIIVKMGDTVMYNDTLASLMDNANPKKNVILQDLQQLDTTGEGFDISITLEIGDDLDVVLAGTTIYFQAEIVAVGVNPGDTYIGGTVPNN